MPIRLGTTSFSDIKIGSSSIRAAYIGNIQIWPESTPPPPPVFRDMEIYIQNTTSTSIKIRIQGDTIYTLNKNQSHTLEITDEYPLEFVSSNDRNFVLRIDGTAVSPIDRRYSVELKEIESKRCNIRCSRN